MVFRNISCTKPPQTIAPTLRVTFWRRQTRSATMCKSPESESRVSRDRRRISSLSSPSLGVSNSYLSLYPSLFLIIFQSSPHALISSPIIYTRFLFGLSPVPRFFSIFILSILFTIFTLFLPRTRPYHFDLFSLIFPAMLVTPKLPLIHSFLILFSLITPYIDLSTFTSANFFFINRPTLKRSQRICLTFKSHYAIYV